MISIIIPVYNAEEYLDECIKSIVSQEFKDLEIILVDDGSTDKSPLICNKFAQTDSRIKVFHKENEGVSIARNIGLQNCHGEWLMFVDSDDYLLPNAISTLYDVAQKNESDVAFGNVYQLKGTEKKAMFDLHEFCSSNVVDTLPSFALWGYLIKREPIARHHLKFTDGLAYSEDALFWDELALLCKKISITDSFVYVYRDNPFSACNSKQFERKIRHQFWAAQLVGAIIAKYKIRYPKKVKAIHNDELEKIKLGISVAVESDLSPKYCIVKNIFKEYFPEKYRCYFVYQYCLIFSKYHIKRILKSLIKI